MQHNRRVEALGILGGIITNTAILPQIYKSYSTRSTRDLSWAMFATYYAGVLMMFVYGVLITEPAVIVSTCYSILTNTMLVYMKWYFEVYQPHAAAQSGYSEEEEHHNGAVAMRETLA